MSQDEIDQFKSDNIKEVLKKALEQVQFQQELKDDDDAEAANIQYEINSYGGDFDIFGLVRRFENKDIYFPEFQRNYVWTKKQASRFIESILIGLPIPSLFLYKEEKENKLLIIDGLQRISTLHAFINNKFPHTGQTFNLSGLPNGSQFYNKTYEQLAPKDKRTFENTVIHIQFIQQTSPEDDHSAAFNIFERLNSGGTPLQAQEMRNALYEGSFQKQLVELNEKEQWREIFNGQLHKRSKDIELILRFLALYNWEEHYKPPMKIFLNRFMRYHKDAEIKKLDEFSKIFNKTLDRAYEALGEKAFHLGAYNSFSPSFFDAFMVAIASNESATKDAIIKASEKLQAAEDFYSPTSSGTTAYKAISRRIELAREALNAST
jgi:uncharacterized protein with ParB-like and HNH nuclease domain